MIIDFIYVYLPTFENIGLEINKKIYLLHVSYTVCSNNYMQLFFFLIGNVHLKETISVLDINVRFERTENTVKNSLTLICLGI